MSRMEIFGTDVLVLGAGLAGMRAAWAALAAQPELDVRVVSSRYGASGASFANINNKLGMQVCLDDEERAAFCREAVAIAPPGAIDPTLVQLMAEDGESRFRELVDIGFPFDRGPDGEYVRVAGCFSPDWKRAHVFSNLTAAFSAMRARIASLGGKFMEGWWVQDLFVTEQGDCPGVCGALLRNTGNGQLLAVKARAIIFALGGPAALYHQNVAGPGTDGSAPALLKRAGAPLVNMPFIQFLWHTVQGRQFFSIQSCVQPGGRIRNRSGEFLTPPAHLGKLAADRSTHCPMGYGTRDGAIDRFMIEAMAPNGEIDVFVPQYGWTAIGLMAHAENGGAKINRDAWSGVNGLYVCGESAGGMHGANRMGGAMVLATQVFGARAGKAATKYAVNNPPVNAKRLSRLVETALRNQPCNEQERREVFPWLRRGMQAFTIIGERPGADNFMSECLERLEHAKDWHTRLVLESALIVGGRFS